MSAAFVLDASMAFAWVLPSQTHPAAEALLERVEKGDEVVVPPLWFLEVANGLLAAERRKTMAAPERRLALERLSALALTIDAAHAQDAFGRTSALAEQYGLSVYDAAYLEVAIRRNLPLGTRDRALRAAAERSGIPQFDH
ncbi:MAG: type II toxin-antitoxin system VapC family toxin [Gammaproteobacteria bacterium]|nr:type II toxin-antitoxin system VapC family toxin [Gammaproteobacteria bacterium]